MSNTNSTDLELSSSQYWSITDASQTGLDITGDITVEAWIKLESVSSVLMIASKDNGSVSRSWDFFVHGTLNYLAFNYYSNNSTNTTMYSSSSIDSSWIGVWHHVAVAVDVSAKTAKFYFDGVEETANIDHSNSASIQNSSAPFIVGAALTSNNPNYFFDGKIDEVRIWNDIRTAIEIADNYKKELTGNEANLQGYWKFNNNGDDETSNNNDLTNNNSATFVTDVPFSGAVANTTNFFNFFN